MSDLIDRRAVLDGIEELKNSPWYNYGKDTTDFRLERYNERVKTIETIEDLCIKSEPSVTPTELTGHWISMNTGKQSHLKDGMTTESVKCSECDEWLTASDEYACNGNYCPNCGCRMVEPQESEEE